MASFKFCPSCGVETDGTKFCVECGADLRPGAYGPAAGEAAPKEKGREEGQASGPASTSAPVAAGVPAGKPEAKKSISDVSLICVAPVAEGVGGADADGAAEVGRWTRKRKLAGVCVAGVILVAIGFATVVLASGASDGSGQRVSKMTAGTTATTAGATGDSCKAVDCARVEAGLRGLKLDPAPLFPSTIPEALKDAKVTVSHDIGEYDVNWQFGGGYIFLTRGPASDFNELRHPSNMGPIISGKVRVGAVTAWHFCGHRCGYFFLKNGRTYRIQGIYFDETNDSRVAQDERSIIASLKPVTR